MALAAAGSEAFLSYLMAFFCFCLVFWFFCQEMGSWKVQAAAHLGRAQSAVQREVNAGTHPITAAHP